MSEIHGEAALEFRLSGLGPMSTLRAPTAGRPTFFAKAALRSSTLGLGVSGQGCHLPFHSEHSGAGPGPVAGDAPSSGARRTAPQAWSLPCKLRCTGSACSGLQPNAVSVFGRPTLT